MPKPSLSQPAASSVTKACRILRALSQAPCRLTDLTQRTGLDKATALRILEMLQAEGFVERAAQDKRYFIGAELRMFGAAATAGADLRAIARPSLLRLANAFEDTVLVSVRRGNESLCLDLEEGRFPIRANYMNVGGRRPWAWARAASRCWPGCPTRSARSRSPHSTAVLALHPRVSGELARTLVDDARSRGYAMTLNVVVDRMGGVGVPILGPDGNPVAALSIAALSDRILGRHDAIVAALRDEAQACRKRLLACA